MSKKSFSDRINRLLDVPGKLLQSVEEIVEKGKALPGEIVLEGRKRLPQRFGGNGDTAAATPTRNEPELRVVRNVETQLDQAQKAATEVVNKASAAASQAADRVNAAVNEASESLTQAADEAAAKVSDAAAAATGKAAELQQAATEAAEKTAATLKAKADQATGKANSGTAQAKKATAKAGNSARKRVGQARKQADKTTAKARSTASSARKQAGATAAELPARLQKILQDSEFAKQGKIAAAKLRKATIDDLTELKGIGEKSAQDILNWAKAQG